MTKLNQGISTPIGILIVVICALIVGGILAWQYWWVPKEEVPPTITKPEVAEPTADWKTYRNEEYEFEVKYPENWFFTENTRGEGIVIFTNFKFPAEDGRELKTTETKLVIYVKNNPENLSLEEWINRLSSSGNLGLVSSKEEIETTNIKGTRVEGCVRCPTTYITIFVPRDETMFEIVNYSNRDKLDQILSTFKFLE